MQITGDFVFAMGLWGMIGAALSVVAVYSMGGMTMISGGTNLGGSSGGRRWIKKLYSEPDVDELKGSLSILGDELKAVYETRRYGGIAAMSGNMVALYGINNASNLIKEAANPVYIGKQKVVYNLGKAMEDLSLVERYAPADKELSRTAKDAKKKVVAVLKKLETIEDYQLAR